MKDKRILAMFITSAVALVASVVITLGIALTLADPVPATLVARCEFNFGASNSSEIIENGDVLTYENAIVFQPSGSVTVTDWDMNTSNDIPVLFTKDLVYTDEIMYADESLPNRVELAAFRINNSTAQDMNINIKAVFNKESNLGMFTKFVVYDYGTHTFYTESDKLFTLEAGEYKDFALLVFADVTDNYQGVDIDFGSAKEDVSIVVTKTVLV